MEECYQCKVVKKEWESVSYNYIDSWSSSAFPAVGLDGCKFRLEIRPVPKSANSIMNLYIHLVSEIPSTKIINYDIEISNVPGANGKFTKWNCEISRSKPVSTLLPSYPQFGTSNASGFGTRNASGFGTSNASGLGTSSPQLGLIKCRIELLSPILHHYSTEIMDKLFNDESSTDVVVHAAGKNFRAHRAVLSACSPVLKLKIMQSGTDEITIDELSPVAVEGLLQFIYKGTMAEEMDAILEILVAAEKYDIPRLKSACEDAASSRLTVQNAIAALIVAEHHNAANLYEKARNLAKLKINDVKETDSFKKARIEHPGLLVDALI